MDVEPKPRQTRPDRSASASNKADPVAANGMPPGKARAGAAAPGQPHQMHTPVTGARRGRGDYRGPGSQKMDGRATDASILAGLIDGEVLPRLLLAHGVPSDRRHRSEVGSRPVQDDAEDCAIPQGVAGIDPAARIAASARLGEGAEALVAEAARLTLSDDADALGRFLAESGLGELSLEDLFLGLLGPAARRLGQQWEEDTISFTDVTLGLGRLQGLFDTLRHSRLKSRARSHAPTILIAAVPGEQHTFGVAITDFTFSEAGWRVEAVTGLDHAGLMRRIAGSRADVLALSLSSHSLLPAAQELVAAVRALPDRAGLRIMAGGAMVSLEPNLRHLLGADAIVHDAREAVRIAEDMVAFPG